LNATELEMKYLERVNRSGSLLLLPAADALQLIGDLADADARFLGVEAFRLFDDGGVQPAMQFSNISFGRVEQKDGAVKVKSFRRGLRDGWSNDPDALSRTKDLIQKGRASGYDWYEVSIEDPDTGELLFFREFEK
jgi:predicted DNA-binding WGR domain protein